jgi:glutaredoxin
MSEHKIVILPARRCRRSQKIMKYLSDHGILFERIDLESPEGQAIAERYGMRASPGILVDGVSYNPLDLLISPGCRVDEKAARVVFGVDGKDGT